MALPTAVSGLPCIDAVAATIISGAEEPIATIVRPIIIGEIPKFLANDDAPKTNLSALQTKATRAMSNIKICSNINDSKVKSKLSLVVEQKRSKYCQQHENNILLSYF